MARARTAFTPLADALDDMLPALTQDTDRIRAELAALSDAIAEMASDAADMDRDDLYEALLGAAPALDSLEAALARSDAALTAITPKLATLARTAHRPDTRRAKVSRPTRSSQVGSDDDDDDDDDNDGDAGEEEEGTPGNLDEILGQGFELSEQIPDLYSAVALNKEAIPSATAHVFKCRKAIYDITGDAKYAPMLNDNDDFIITGETETFKDPFTAATITAPVRSKCGHHFDRASVLAMLGRQRQIECPVPGCPKYVRAEELEEDPAYERRLRRFVQRQERDRNAARTGLTIDDDEYETV
ncbi:hypothetical protein BC828DRAFT_409701 [Blastocladiella britannica]|nr:hypothetical protein BC828DRAFT_409701 [Blastocladiella britannica]